MMYKTHSAFGAAAAAAVLVVLGWPLAPLALIAGAIGGVLPDIDHPASKVSTANPLLKIVGMLYRLVLRIVAFTLGLVASLLKRFGLRVPATSAGHRGPLTHSPFAVLIFGVLLWPVAAFDWKIYAAMLVGVLSHVAIDTLNPGGTPLLYPLTARKFSLLPKFIAPVTGSFGETVVRFFVYILLAAAVIASVRNGLTLSFGAGPMTL